MSDQPALHSLRRVVVLAHPDPHSFNALIAETYCAAVRKCGQEATVRDLCAMGFESARKAAEQSGERGFILSKDVEAEFVIICDNDVRNRHCRRPA